MRGDKKLFLNNIKKVCERLKKEDDILVVGHYDADGITSCAILVDALRYLGKEVRYMILKKLDSKKIQVVEETAAECVVFSDMGSGQLELLENSEIKKFYIVDHHPPIKAHENQLNPHFFGYDGSIDISGSGVAYLVAKTLGKKDMAHIAVVGAVGDMQDSRGRLMSLNREIMKAGVKYDLLKVKHDLRLFGRQSRPIHVMLTYASEPVLPGLTGNKKACIEFLENLGIGIKNPDGSWKHYVDLSFEERQKLTTALYIWLLDLGYPEDVIHGMIGEVYTLVKEKKKTELRDAKEFATLLNACGRQERAEIGVEICLGDRDKMLKKARTILQKHRKAIKEAVEWLLDSGVEEMSNLYYFDSKNKIDENIIGVVAGISYGAGIIRGDKPIVAFATDKEDPSLLKISARANWKLIRRGIHLGDALRECCKEIGGDGGGHDIAAGARVPKERIGEFLSKLNEIFGKQLKK